MMTALSILAAVCVWGNLAGLAAMVVAGMVAVFKGGAI